MAKFSDIRRGGELKEALTNYIKYLDDMSTRQTKRQKGGSVDSEALKSIKIDVLPFSKALLQGNWSKSDISVFGDLLAETDVNPNEYAQALTHNLNFITNHELVVDTNGLDILRHINS